MFKKVIEARILRCGPYFLVLCTLVPRGSRGCCEFACLLYILRFLCCLARFLAGSLLLFDLELLFDLLALPDGISFPLRHHHLLEVLFPLVCCLRPPFRPAFPRFCIPITRAALDFGYVGVQLFPIVLVKQPIEIVDGVVCVPSPS